MELEYKLKKKLEKWGFRKLCIKTLSELASLLATLTSG